MRRNVFLTTILWIACNTLVGQPLLHEVLIPYRDSLFDYGMVVLTDNGKQQQKGAVGYASKDETMTTNHRFCIGSVSKMFTATLVLRLCEKGKLNLNDRIDTYLAPHPFIDGAITIQQLLNHTSGVHDIIDAELANASLLESEKVFTDDYLLSLIDTIDFAKGTRYAYSNSNYFLLRMILEKVSKKPLEKLLKKYIIKPLHLKNTFVTHSNTIAQLAHPMMDGQDLHDLSKTGLNTVSRGIGNIVSDARDLNTFIRGLFIDNQLLNPSSLEMMTAFSTFGDSQVGLGVFYEKYGARMVVGHTGRTVSYITYAFVDLRTKQSVIIMVNNANDALSEHIIHRIYSK